MCFFAATRTFPRKRGLLVGWRFIDAEVRALVETTCGVFAHRVWTDHAILGFASSFDGVVDSFTPHLSCDLVVVPRTFGPEQVASASPCVAEGYLLAVFSRTFQLGEACGCPEFHALDLQLSAAWWTLEVPERH